MLRFLRRGQRWLTAVLVVGLGGVFAFFIGIGAPLQMGRGGAVMGVGPYQFGQSEFERERAQREEQARQTLGEQFDAKALADSLDMLTVQVLSNRALLQISRKDMEIFCMLLMNMARETSRRLRRMNALLASSMFDADRSDARDEAGEKRR